MIPQFCPDATPTFFNLFDFTIAPLLLYYAYIPLIVICMSLAVFVLINAKYSLESKCFFLVASSFTCWVIAVMLHWIAAPVTLVMYAWELIYFLEISVFVTTYYFVYVFLNKKNLASGYQLVLLGIVFPTVVLMPTPLTIEFFDLTICEGVPGPVETYTQFMELVILAALFDQTTKFILRQQKSKKRIFNASETYVAIGAIVFLTFFITTSFVAAQLEEWRIEIFGSIGMAVFITLLAYAIVRFKTFNTKVFATEALVLGIGILVFSQLFVRSVEASRYVTIATLFFVVMFGFALVKSVHREIEQKEKIATLADDLKRANSRLRELDRLKTEFVSIASHQMRSPLTAITGYASLLLEGSFGPVSREVKDAISKIFRSGKNMSVAVDDFLNVTRIEQGRMKYDFDTFDIGTLALSAVDNLKMIADEKKIAIKSEIPREMVFVHADKGKLGQVMTNLIDNAIKYTKEGTIKIGLSTDGEKARLSISDTGIGIPKDEMPELFGKFSRAHNANSANVQGTGLGLYIAKQFIEAHKGQILVESVEGKGTTFTVELPIVKAPTE